MGKFVIKTSDSGQFSFRLKAGNNEVIAVSEMYPSKGACINGIESVRQNAAFSPVEDQTQDDFDTLPLPKFEMYYDKISEFRFRLRAGNGEIIAASEGYTAKDSCLKGIESVRNNAPTAEIVEMAAT